MYKILLIIKLFMEFLGTFIISASFNFSTIYGFKQDLDWVLIFTGFFSAIYITKEISGAHLNPSTTVAVLTTKNKENIIEIEKQKELKLYVFYFISQILGAFFSCFLASTFNKKKIFNFGFNSNVRISNVFLSEVLCGFIYNYTFLCLSKKYNLKKKTEKLIYQINC